MKEPHQGKIMTKCTLTWCHDGLKVWSLRFIPLGRNFIDNANKSVLLMNMNYTRIKGLKKLITQKIAKTRLTTIQDGNHDTSETLREKRYRFNEPTVLQHINVHNGTRKNKREILSSTGRAK